MSFIQIDQSLLFRHQIIVIIIITISLMGHEPPGPVRTLYCLHTFASNLNLSCSRPMRSFSLGESFSWRLSLMATDISSSPARTSVRRKSFSSLRKKAVFLCRRGLLTISPCAKGETTPWMTSSGIVVSSIVKHFSWSVCIYEWGRLDLLGTLDH